MPNKVQILLAAGAAAATAFAILLICGLPWRKPSVGRVGAGWVLGVGAGFYLGCWLLDLWPRWPPAEDKDRFLALLFPGAGVLELLAAWASVPRRLIWALRLVIAAAAARVLLHQTTYIADLFGPGTREWTSLQMWLILGCMAVALAIVWALVGKLAERAPGFSVPGALAVVCAGAGAALMLCGYLSGGQLGVPLAAALGGAACASLFLSGPPPATAAVSLGVVGLYSLLLMGHFLSKLPTLLGVALFATLLLVWLPEAPGLWRLRPGLRGLVRIALVAIPVSILLFQAGQQFVADSRTSPTSQEATADDYLGFQP